MDENKSGMSWIWTLFIILVIWAIFGGGFGGGWGNNNRGPVYGGECGGCGGGCNRVSNCEIERREIIDSATTQYQIEQQGAATRAAVVESGNAIQEQANRIYIQGIQAELFDAKAKINQLESQAYTKDLFNQLSAQTNANFCALNQRFDVLECNTPKRPPLYALSATTCGQIFPYSVCGNCGNI